MSAPIQCPKCGTDQPAGTPACGCGHVFPASIAPAPPPAVERPFDIGKPLGSPHPVSLVCPKCGSGDYKAVQPASMVAFTWDRVCKACSTRYTPLTPVWARAIFGVVGLAAVALGGVMLYGLFGPGKWQPTLGLITPVVVLLVGAGCLYKAATK
jgi:hypothetical protein